MNPYQKNILLQALEEKKQRLATGKVELENAKSNYEAWVKNVKALEQQIGALEDGIVEKTQPQ